MYVEYFLSSWILQLCFIHSTHFRGGTITWRPLNATPSGGSASFLVRERYSWNRNTYYCDGTTIANNGLISGGNNVACTAGPCTGWSNMLTSTYCTDFSAALTVSSGERTQVYTFPLNISFTIYFYGTNWFDGLEVGNSTSWYVSNRIITNVRPDGYLNTSPIGVTIPIIYKPINIQQVHVVQMADFDPTDILRCRWSTNISANNTCQYNECGGICSGVPGAVLLQNNCTIVFTLTHAKLYAGVALQIEDFFNNATLVANTPMSSVPLQFLFYGYSVTGNCTKPPQIIGNRPNRACIGTSNSTFVTESIIVETYCPGQYVTDFVSSSPIGMKKSAIINSSSTIFELILTWNVSNTLHGPEPLCAAAVDNFQLQSNQWCVTFVVGYDSPDVIRPTLVQGSASPVGTVFQNQSVFSFQTTKFVGRPSRNGTNIYFKDAANNVTVAQFDCGWAPEVTFTGYTTVIRFTNTSWKAGHFYYITMEGGVVSGTEFCGPESAPIRDPTYWVFNIWDPAVSSTTTTTTTPFTTATVTTKPTSTTSINTLLTTTGIVVTTTTPITTPSTTSTTTPPTTAAPTTAGPTIPGVTTESTVAVMYPKDFEDACKSSVATMTAVIFAALAPIHTMVMYATFIKLEKKFSPSRVNAGTRHKLRMKKIVQS
ncbi:unnamed protein product [Adineta ricciae]|uniref:Uncharacterized protein n=1 Tax=Adineta ricciae TaxID=249248 RepID=A0A813ULU6_ADIRI|nr:unnamed protein product [Adineta ricciae]